MIKYLFHLSDIHIRNGDSFYSRYDEYNSVFENLFNNIKNKFIKLNINYDEALIIITGDIFHNKNNIGNYGLMLFKILIKNLTTIAKTIILEGNHDSIQHELNQPSLVTSTFEIDNLIILQESKSFIIDDIGFSYVNIRDTLDNCSSSGRKKNLKPFPSINDKNVKYNIALFHGTFASIKLYNGTNVSTEHNPYPFEWIEDFDLALLGDIHLRQTGYYKNKLLWGYSGSLIQQNFGEDIVDHGYIIWDLENKVTKNVNVYNNIGKIVLKEINSKIYFRKTNKFYDLDNYINNNLKYFPKQLEIKCLSNINNNNLHNLLTKYEISYKIISQNNLTKNLQNNNLFTTFTINNDILLDYFHQHLDTKQYSLLSQIIKNYDTLLFDNNDFPNELHDECCKKNKELNLLINNCLLSYDEKKINKSFTISYLEWDNLYCYESDNWIDFSNLLSSTFIISGKNGTGKSAIYDILTIAIWGDITVAKQNDISSGIINYNSDNAYTIINLVKDDICYQIKRTYFRKKENNFSIKINTFLYKNKILIKKDSAAKEEILKLFGTLNNFLSSSMITQNIDNNILKISYKECIQIIDDASNINYLYNLFNLLKNTLNKYKDFNKIVIAKKNVYHSLINTNKNYLNLINENKEKLIKKKEEKINLAKQLKNVTINYDNIDLNIDYENIILSLSNINKNINYDEFNELEFFFKRIDYNYEKILENSTKYYEHLIINLDLNYETIDNEYVFIKDYLNFTDHYKVSLQELQKIFYDNNQTLKNLNDILVTLDNSKPSIVDNIDIDIDSINKYIITLFDTNENFINFYNNNEKYNYDNEINLTANLHYNMYYTNLNKIKSINKRLLNYNNKIHAIEDNINNLILDLTTPLNAPDIPIKFKTSKSTKKYIETYFNNIEEIINFNKENADMYNDYLNYNENVEKLKKYNICDYEYDENCIYCNKRPWVIEINLIKNNLKKVEENIDFSLIKIYIKNLKIIDKYNLHNNWLKYYLYIERKNSININLKSKETFKFLIENDNIELKKITNFNNEFLNITFNLYQKYTIYNNYIKYIKWKESYNDINNKIIVLTKEIDNINKHIYFYEHVKKRLDIYYQTRKHYDNLIIYNSFKYIKYKTEIENYKKYIDLVNKNNYKNNYLINKQINIIDNDIIELNNTISKLETEYQYVNTNLTFYNKLLNTENNINDKLSVIQIIIDKFKDYKKWLYNNFILKNIVTNANNYIKLLCHDNCKPFMLDYLLTENKDIIHINWLIKNDSQENQLISINQASGFQNFVISMALRLSLYGNKNCNQLFIDEGFTACDKENLSIVPVFLKKLLLLFETVIIVSHIDIIQDNVEDKITINYNKKKNFSNIKYGLKQD
jgi:exonuclease SbcC